MKTLSEQCRIFSHSSRSSLSGCFRALVATIVLTLTVQVSQAFSAALHDPYFGLRVMLPPDWKIASPEGVDDTVMGYSGRFWKIEKDPMTFVSYQVIDHDISNENRFAEYRQRYFTNMSASMKAVAKKAGAQSFHDQGQRVVGGLRFDTLTWILQAPNRPQLTSALFIGSLKDKAVTLEYSCTGPDCLSAQKAMETVKFSALQKESALWNFKIPSGWTKVALSSSDEKLSIQKGKDNTLVFSLMEDESQELSSMSMAEIKMSLFNESLKTFRGLAEESGLNLTSDEEEVVLGKQTFQVLSIGLVPPDQDIPAYVVGQMISIIDRKLAMILITCVDEQTCGEIEQAVGASSF